MLSVAKGDAIIHVLPPAIRFWEKLGLGPRGGKKDVVAWVLFENEGEEKEHQVEAWLASVSATYTVSGFPVPVSIGYIYQTGQTSGLA